MSYLILYNTPRNHYPRIPWWRHVCSRLIIWRLLYTDSHPALTSFLSPNDCDVTCILVSFLVVTNIIIRSMLHHPLMLTLPWPPSNLYCSFGGGQYIYVASLTSSVCLLIVWAHCCCIYLLDIHSYSFNFYISSNLYSYCQFHLPFAIFSVSVNVFLTVIPNVHKQSLPTNDA